MDVNQFLDNNLFIKYLSYDILNMSICIYIYIYIYIYI